MNYDSNEVHLITKNKLINIVFDIKSPGLSLMMASKLLVPVRKITLFQRLVTVPHQNSEEKKLEDWEKCLKWLKSLNIRSAKVPSLDSVNSDSELYHYLKVP